MNRARNVSDLHRIAIFNPLFRKVYGLAGILAILVVALCVFGLGLAWLAPWHANYSSEELRGIWQGVLVMPFAGLLAGSFLVEFLLKCGHLILWAWRRELVVGWRGKAWGVLMFLSGVPGGILAASYDYDAYGLVLVVISALSAYGLVVQAWDESLRARFGEN